MPELPEVETIRNLLRRGGAGALPILNRFVVGCSVLWAKTVAEPSLDEFHTRIAGQVIKEIDRRGKYLILNMDKDHLLVHLRMSGDLYCKPSSEALSPHARLILDLDDTSRLIFEDARKFGRVWLVKELEGVLGKLGFEPLSAEFTDRIFYEGLISFSRQIKPLLSDQTFIAGLGNIYIDESLHLAKLHPLTLSNQLSSKQAEKLWRSIRIVLEEGIKRNGASIDWVYKGGDFQNYFRVYRRTGLACLECSTPIERIIVGQRSTHFCPNCQKLLV